VLSLCWKEKKVEIDLKMLTSEIRFIITLIYQGSQIDLIDLLGQDQVFADSFARSIVRKLQKFEPDYHVIINTKNITRNDRSCVLQKFNIIYKHNLITDVKEILSGDVTYWLFA